MLGATKSKTVWRLTNLYYNRLSEEQKERFFCDFSLYSFVLRGLKVRDREWTVWCGKNPVIFPLRHFRFAEDFGLALCLWGLDGPVKRLYSMLLKNNHNPTLVYDVGVNLGQNLHLFLAYGLDCRGFEPNPECFSEINRILARNRKSCFVARTAIGNDNCSLLLRFPKGESWYGTVSGEAVPDLEDKEIQEVTVSQGKLDDFLPEDLDGKIWIKLDVEGHELSALKGAKMLLSSWDCLVIFEHQSYRKDGKKMIHRYITDLGYLVSEIPSISSANHFSILNEQKFLESQHNNFLCFKPDGYWGNAIASIGVLL